MGDAHDTGIQAVRDGIYTTGFFAACACGWTGPERERASATLPDILQHTKEAA